MMNTSSSETEKEISKYMNQSFVCGLERQLEECTADMSKAVARGRLSLEEQVRAYDLLDRLLEMRDSGPLGADASSVNISEAFCLKYESEKEKLSDVYDEDALKDESEKITASLRKEMEEARFAAASAASLHEFAKDVFDIWQNSGIFARRRALRELRERAGFRLESHRIGNYVAKTFDLMNEAQSVFAKSQQAVFASDVKYKIRQDIYGEIYRLLCKKRN